MIDDIIAAIGGIAKLVEIAGEIFDRRESRAEFQNEFQAYLTHIHSEAEIRKRLRGELVPDTDPAPAPEFDPLPDPWARKKSTEVDR